MSDYEALGLSTAEYKQICQSLNRKPNDTELAIFSVMWSEHCSYKSSRKELAKLPSTGACVLQGPGENAGVVDIGDNQAAVFKIESHNHPSFIEPYQGAATGVGGILRDVFCMGARPIALLNALRFGELAHPKTKHLLAGVVAGIGDYGNCIGVPTVGGELGFDKHYNDNILVNAMCVGLAEQDKIFTAQASGVGNAVVYVGAKTGRDGIHGATMASAEFSDDAASKRPTVQIGDPFYEKLLLEACLELLQEDAVLALQDMGAAGLTSSSVEMASKGGVGIDLQLDKVPQREANMQPFEIMLSESQERMLMIIKPDRLEIAEQIFAKWELSYARIGTLTDSKHLRLFVANTQVADLPLLALDEMPDAPRPASKPVPAPMRKITPAKEGIGASLLRLLASPDLCSRRWVWEQYDSMVMGDSLATSGGDAAVVRVHQTNKGLAMACDVTPRYCQADPEMGGKQAIAESWRNLTATGATPLAWTNCLNFGNPEKPEMMGSFVACLAGMRQAALALDYPVVSGNVSFYNETNRAGILPTPTIGGVGLVPNIAKRAVVGAEENMVLFLVGESNGHLGCSLYAQHIVGDTKPAAPPPVDLNTEQKNGDFVRGLITQGACAYAHDLADGGLLVALAEICLASGLGLTLEATGDAGFWFGEDQARYVIALAPAEAQKHTAPKDIALQKLGIMGGDALTFADGQSISCKELEQAQSNTLPDYMRE